MTDELDKLARALRQATPEAAPDARARAIAAAEAAFAEKNAAAAQGTADRPRHSPDRAQGARGWMQGIVTMFQKFNSRPVLLATTAVATLGVGVVLTQQIARQGLPEHSPSTETTAGAERQEANAPAASDALARRTATSTDEADSSVRGQLQTGASGRAGASEEEARPVIRSDDALAAAPEPEVVFEAPVESEVHAAPTAAAPLADGDPAIAGLRLREASKAVIVPPPSDAITFEPPQAGDRFESAGDSPLKQVAAEPVSTFSIDVDTASYAYVRNALMQGVLPPPASVRIEEMVNYFDYAYPAPDNIETPFSTSVAVTQTPWNAGTRLMQIGIRGYDVPAAERPPLNLVFLIDTSGSMQDANKLPLLVRSFHLLLDTLTEKDSVAIVTYAGSAGTALEPTPASKRAKIEAVLDGLIAGGSTAGHAGLQGAYALADQMKAEGEVTRVILATDGDFNVGLDDPDGLEAYIERQRRTGTYLSVLGFGTGNLNDVVMQRLAQNGNGMAAYIDTLAEAQKVLVEDVAGSLVPIANDVKIQVEFNPATVAEYRLLGYETRALAREDFNNDAVDAGEIGSGHMVTAIYEVTPVGSPAVSIDPLRYAETEAAPVSAEPSDEYAFVKLRYKRPGESVSQLVTTPVSPDRADFAASESGFAAAVAGFGELLRGGSAMGDWGYDDARALASASRGEDAYGYRAEFLSLVRLAEAADRR